MKNFVLGVIVTIFIGGLIYGFYRYGVTQQFPKVMEPSISPTALLLPSASPSLSDNELIEEALVTKNNWDKGLMKITVTANDGEYASGTATAEGGGGYFFAAKVNEFWEIVADGNGVIFCESLKDYPYYPSSLISECYDKTTNTSIKR